MAKSSACVVNALLLNVVLESLYVEWFLHLHFA